MLRFRLLSLILGFMVAHSVQATGLSLDSLEKSLYDLKQSAAIPAISFGYAQKGAEHQFIQVGLSDSENNISVEPDTIFEAASLSKPVLSFITLRLAERGRISLDRPLVEYLDNSRVVNKSWGKLITARIVLSHQTGFSNWSNGNLDFKFKPGTDFGYSGEGYVYLQKVLEKITGLSFQELAEKEVFKPLGMKNSYFTWSKTLKLKLAQGHDRAGSQVNRGIPEANAAASLHTTPEDYLKFIQAWFNEKYISASSRNEAFKSYSSKKQGDPETQMSWGLGWGAANNNNGKVLWHWGDNGVFRAFTAFQPESQIAFVYFANSENGLAISKQLTEKILPGNQSIFNWLNYGQSDSPLWQAERKGYELESKGKFADAKKLFQKVLDKYPDNQRIKNKLVWLEPLLMQPKDKLELTDKIINQLVGQYGERKLFVEDGFLKYQRGKGSPYLLKAFYGNVFKVGEFTGFRLEIVFDEEGNPESLIGLYENGFTDKSERSD